MGINAVARCLGVAGNTVRLALRSDASPHYTGGLLSMLWNRRSSRTQVGFLTGPVVRATTNAMGKFWENGSFNMAINATTHSQPKEPT